MTTEITLRSNDLIPACDKEGLAHMERFASFLQTVPQADMGTDHFVFAGCYVRTIKAEKGTVFAGGQVTIPTVLVICGKGKLFCGQRKAHVDGYYVLRGEAHRQVAFIAEEDTYFTMFYATEKDNPIDCEEEFTDHPDKLITRRQQCQQQ